MESFLKSQSIMDIFEDLDYNPKDILNRLLENTKDSILQERLIQYINDNSYLKTLATKG